MKWYEDVLREGEQNPNVILSRSQKAELIPKIIDAGADAVVLMPAVHFTEEQLVKELCDGPYRDRICVTTMLRESQFKQAKYIGATRLIPFAPVSDRMIKYMGIDRDSHLKKVKNKLKTAYDMGFRLDFAALDAPNGNLDYEIGFFKEIGSYIRGGTILPCDTVGGTDPVSYGMFISEIVKNAPDGVNIGVHCHNDRGMANKNTVAGVNAGATVVDTSIDGFGDRAGNADTEEVLFALKEEGIVLPGVKYEKLHELSNEVCLAAGREGKPAKSAEVGSPEAFYTVAGIHAWILLQSRKFKEPSPFLANKYGQKDVVVLGKTMGNSNIIYYEDELKPLLGELTDLKCTYLRDQIKTFSIAQKRPYTIDEIKYLLKKGILIVHPNNLEAQKIKVRSVEEVNQSYHKPW
jgi:isopropylmalate/homocitrate/citramalate synthase